MKFRIGLRALYSDEACSSNIYTIDVPGINTSFWICIFLEVKFFWFTHHSTWSIHLV